MTTAKAPEAPKKSAADTLIERLAEKELKESINPLAVESDVEVKEALKGTDANIVRRKTFANGAVFESYA